LEKDSETFPSFFSKGSFIYIFFFKFFDFMTCNGGNTKTCYGKGVNKNMVDEGER
jgi:hypothetical protein